MKDNRDGIIIIFVSLIVFCIFTIVFSFINLSLFVPIRNVIGFVLVPVQSSVNTFGRNIIKFATDRKDLKLANEEIEKLNQEINELIEDNNRLKSETYELVRLRQLYELDQEYMQYKKVACRVIAKDSEKWFQVFRIDKGSRDGIKVNMNVLSGGGLLGIVTDVGLNYATVRSILDDESRVIAMTQHSNVSCTVCGDIDLYNTGRIRISHVDLRTQIADGDKIVTSNISSKYLPGILIGYATDVKVDETQLTKSGYLIPIADFDNLAEVLVITQTKDDYMKEKQDAEK